ncbi:MAG: hypothetical protein AB1529_02995 [Candidatus Micrarchaeota archaeon]
MTGAPAQRRRGGAEETTGLTQQEVQRTVISQLQALGYSPLQAREIYTRADQVARGREGVVVPPYMAQGDFMNVATRLNEILNHRLNKRFDEARRLLNRNLGIRNISPEITLRTPPAPVMTHRHSYEVTVDGRTYTIDANRDLRWSGTMTRADQTKGGRLITYLESAAPSDFRITTTDAQGREVMLTRDQFMAAARPAYVAIQREFASAHARGETPDLDVISRIDVRWRSRAERERG